MAGGAYKGRIDAEMPTGRAAMRHTQFSGFDPVRTVCLVAGKTRGVTHIMGSIVQRSGLNVACQRNHCDTQRQSEKGGHHAQVAACHCLCCHVFSPYRHTRRILFHPRLAGLLARGSWPFPAFPAVDKIRSASGISGRAHRLQSRGRLQLGATCLD